MAKIENIGIVSWGSISALGNDPINIWEQYVKPTSHIHFSDLHQTNASTLPDSTDLLLKDLRLEKKYYSELDRSVLLSILATRKAIKTTNWLDHSNIGVNIGSSRGATQLFEQFHQSFTQKQHLKDELLASPLTTLGNISSWTAKDIESSGLAFSHSMTCSTSFHSILNGVAWLQSGLSNRFIVGGTEAPITAFTLAQMQALRIYSDEQIDFPCQAMNLDKSKNSMVLGEGAAVFCLEKNPPKSIAWIKGIGFATESIEHPTSISKDGFCMQKSMQMALTDFDPSDVDIIITHSPGTVRGDQSEWNAIESVFGQNPPAITCNKWKIGHTLGASGGLSLELGLLMILHQQFIPIPYIAHLNLEHYPKKIENILINTVGFGGTAVSILIGSKPKHS